MLKQVQHDSFVVLLPTKTDKKVRSNHIIIKSLLPKGKRLFIRKRRDCLDLFALNVSTCFATEFSTLCKSTPHSAHRSLELWQGVALRSSHLSFMTINKGADTFKYQLLYLKFGNGEIRTLGAGYPTQHLSRVPP